MTRAALGLPWLLLAAAPHAAAQVDAAPTSAARVSRAIPPRPRALVLDGVTVIDVEHGERWGDQRVVVVGSRIRAMGRRGAVRVPRGARVVAAPGTYVIPGLWDMHIHPTITIDEDSTARVPIGPYNQLIANGITGIRDAGSGVPLAVLREWKQAIASGALVGPRMLVSGPAVNEADSGDAIRISSSGTQRMWNHIQVPRALVRRAIDSLRAAGADMIKTYTMSPAMYFAVAAEARRLGVPFAGHLPMGDTDAWRLDGRQASDSGARILDHWSYFYPAVCGNGSSYGGVGYGANDTSAARCAAAGERLRRNDTWVTDFPVAWPGGAKWSDSAHTAFRRRATSYAGPTINGLLEPGAGGLEPELDSWKPLTAAERRRLPSGADWARQAGVDSTTGRPKGCGETVYPADFPLLANSDFPATGGAAGAMIHRYLLTKVLCGTPALAALQAATLNPARALHATDSLGTVAVGKLADLVLLEGDPLTDIWNTTKIRAVIAGGRYFDRAALDRLLVEAAADYKAGLERRKAAEKRQRARP